MHLTSKLGIKGDITIIDHMFSLTLTTIIDQNGILCDLLIPISRNVDI